MNQDIAKNLSKLLQTFNDKRVISEGEVQSVLQAIVAILAENKKSVEALNTDTRTMVDQEVIKLSDQYDLKSKIGRDLALKAIADEHSKFLKENLKEIKQNTVLTKSEIEKSTKQQNDRAFKRLQELIDHIELPKDGQDGKDGINGEPGKDGSPDTPIEVRDKLESLTGNKRLDVSAIKGLADYFKVAKKAGKQMLVGGIRFFENLADVSILPTKKRQDLLAQYNNTNNRWENGIALTVGTTQPTNPQVGDLWVDSN